MCCSFSEGVSEFIEAWQTPSSIRDCRADEAVGDEEIPKQVFVFKSQDCWENISEGFKIVHSSIFIHVHTSFMVFAAIIRLSSEGAFVGSLRCNKF